MKKIAKISLVAAIAVAGFTTANAQPLEEAIKNVDVTGSVVYRYNETDNDIVGGTSGNTNNYKVALGLASKVNEDVKFNSRFIVGAPSTVKNTTATTIIGNGDAGFATLDSSDNADQNVGVELSNAYFGYTGLKNTTVNVGKQGLTTPWTVAVDSDNNEQTGTGILALSTVGPVTLAGAYFNQTNLDKSTDAVIGNNSNTTTRVVLKNTAASLDGAADVSTIGVIATFAPVTADAWFLDLKDTFDTYTIGAKSSFDVASVKLVADARFTSLTFDGPAEKANTLAKISLSADAGLIDGKIAYAVTDKDGGLVALDNDATTNLLGWNLSANGKDDADYIQAVVGIDILSNLNLSANYGNVEYVSGTTDVEEEEVYAQLLYKMSKNLSTYVRYGTYTNEEVTAGTKVERNDDTRGRLQVEYTF